MMPRPAMQDLTKKIFLVVDDFEPMRRVTWSQLRAMGVTQILTANNGAEALRILARQRIDIVLADWNMPVMSGFELLEAMRADERLSQLPFIMITAEAETRHIEAAIQAGVNDLLVKPYTANRLAERVERALVTPRRIVVNPAKPVARAAAAAGAQAAVTPADGSDAIKELPRPTVLIVDDSADNLMLLAELFKDEYRVKIANSGPKALAICQSDAPPDLVLLDIMMPGMDGFEVAHHMRAHPASESIPVIFVTAMASDEARVRGLGLGAVDFISKPIDPAVLKPRVRNFMRFMAQHRQSAPT
jgi:hypothetical protein